MSDSKKKLYFKGFDKDFKCRGFQFEVGKTYEHDGPVKICESGFHVCEDPLDVLKYYDITSSRFALVEIAGDQKTHDDDSKIAAARIEIKAEIDVGEYVKKAVDWLVTFCKTKAGGEISSGDYSTTASSGDYSTAASSGDHSRAASSGYYSTTASSGDYSTAASSGDYSTAASSGDSSKAASSGDYSTAASSGYYSKAASSGYYSTTASSGYSSKAASSGDYSTAASSGYSSKAASSGDYSTAASSGDHSRAASSGYSSKAASSGDYSTASVEGKNCAAAAVGRNARVKGSEGSWLAVTEYNSKGECIGFATGCIGKDGFKPDTFYIAKDGQLVEAS